MVARKNKKIQAACESKDFADLLAVADYYIDPNEYRNLEDIDIVEAMHEAVMRGIDLAERVRSRSVPNLTGWGRSHAPLNQSLYIVSISRYPGADPALFFFVGTVDLILKRLAKYEDATV